MATICSIVILGTAIFILSAIFYSCGTSSFSSTPHVDRGSIAIGGGDSINCSSMSSSRGGAISNGVSPSADTRLEGDVWKAVPRGIIGKTPPRDAFRLTKEMVGHRARDNVIIVAFGNYAHLDFVLNWARHLARLNLTNLLVGAMDTELLEALYREGVPVFDVEMEAAASNGDAAWETAAFHKMQRGKALLVNAFLELGFELLMSDTDVAWFKNPLEYFAKYPEADVLTSGEQVTPTHTDDSLEAYGAHDSYNNGIVYWRPTEPSLRLAKEWKDMLLADETLWDQGAFNDLLRRVSGRPFGDDGLFYAFDGSLKLGVLPVSVFCNGHTYFVQDLPRQLRLEPYAAHTTYSGVTDAKRHRLREATAFFDPPEYFDPPGGLMSFKTSIPRSLWLGGAHTIDSHFSLVNYQIKEIRTALAIASLLNRTLVMPPLWCRLDRLWFQHPGIIAGSLTRQPFICPMDHVFRVDNMLRAYQEVQFGPRIEFREHSFLNNPLLPRQVKESRIKIQPCHKKSPDCNATRPGVIKLRENTSEDEIARILSLHKSVKVIEFSSMDGVLRNGFADKEREEKFRRRVKTYAGDWCCAKESPIPIPFDMYWDEKHS